MWGIDYCMDHLMKMCILDNMNMKHCLSSYNSTETMKYRLFEIKYLLEKFPNIIQKYGNKKYVIYKILFMADTKNMDIYRHAT